MGRPQAAPEAQAKGLVLTEDGVADPQKKEEEPSAPKGWHRITRKGWKPDGRDYRLGSRQPGLLGVRPKDMLWYVLRFGSMFMLCSC